MVLAKQGPRVVVEPARSIADQVYEGLKQEIINGGLAPGDRLREQEVAALFSASRTPVREALARLEQDYLVERLAQGGVRVASLDQGAIEDLFRLRAVLEAHAIELACARITPEQIAALKQIRAQARELLKSREVSRDYLLRRFLDLNSQFHETIYQATGSRFLIRLISHLRGIVLGMRLMSIQAEHSLGQTWQEHSRLIGLLERGDQEAAVALIRRHIAQAAKQALAVKGKRR